MQPDILPPAGDGLNNTPEPAVGAGLAHHGLERSPCPEVTRATTKHVNGRQSSKDNFKEKEGKNPVPRESRYDFCKSTGPSPRDEPTAILRRLREAGSDRLQAADPVRSSLWGDGPLPPSETVAEGRRSEDDRAPSLSSRRLLPRRMHAENLCGPPFNSKVFLQRL